MRLEGEMLLLKNKVNMMESRSGTPIPTAQTPAFEEAALMPAQPSYPVNHASNLTAKNL